MKKSLFITAVLATTISFASCNKTKTIAQNDVVPTINKPIIDGNTKIQVALLLDTSGSMDGLIEQAKSRLWNIVNTLTTLKYEGKNPDIEISLYEYGNAGLSQSSNYIRQIIPLSTDLDLISEKLFALSTNGGDEYCGAVIQDATKKLQWGTEKNNMKLIYICGNEGFNQGGVNYKESISDALKNNIFVNTIFCGNQQEGIDTFWKNGADVGQGKYFNIDSNQIVEYVSTPFDDEITKCNDKINDTYINYGAIGHEKKASQMKEDSNAKTISAANMTARALSKSKAVYKNENWDLVDKAKQDKEIVTKIKKSELPVEYRNKTNDELKVIISEKTTARENIKKQISELAKKRQNYIDTEAKKAAKTTKDDLGNAINSSIISLAKVKGYTVEN